MSIALKNEGRSASLRKRRFYAKYMGWVERVGYAVVLLVIGSFIYAFNARVDDVISADGVELTPAFAAVAASGPTLVVRRFPVEDAEVAKGAPLLEIVEGDANADAYRRWAAARLLGDPALAARYPKPATRIVAAERAGTFHSSLPPGDFAPVAFAEKAEIARVTDFNEIHAQASLAGDTASRASTGGSARLLNFAFPNPDGVTFRGATASGTALASRDLLPADLKAEIETALKGQSVRLKNDVVAIRKVSDVQINANVRTEPASSGTASNGTASGGNPAPLDLAGGATLSGRVASGKAVASAQLVDLPAPIAARVRERIAALAGREVALPDGTVLRITRADGSGALIKISTEGIANGPPALSATPLKTTFDADVIVSSPPAALVRALRDAAKTGKPVTARVEMVTGTRPLAFLLLKRS